MKKIINPGLLSYLEAENQFLQEHTTNKVRRVKIDAIGHACQVRFLPVELGEKKLWFARRGQHWLNKVPINCPRAVAEDFGGNPNAHCAVCDLAADLNLMPDRDLSDFGFRLRANLSYLTYCLVIATDVGRGEIVQQPPEELIKPWEFQLYKGTFGELMGHFRHGYSAERPLSVLDVEAGNDFWANKTQNGIRLDRQDACPIFDVDESFEERIESILEGIPGPKISIPTLGELTAFARKAEAAARGGSGAGLSTQGENHAGLREGRDRAAEGAPKMDQNSNTAEIEHPAGGPSAPQASRSVPNPVPRQRLITSTRLLR